jgi:two-component system cell cycle response regulator DivK
MHKILLVEDNERNRKLVRTILEYRGYEVIECDDGTPSLELARQHKPVLVLMDIQLPTMDGITALLRLRSDAETASIPVVAVTASVTHSERDKVVAAGFNGYVSKPIDVTTFGEMVDSHVSGTGAKA